MKSIVVASTNPVKIRCALEGFQRMFPDEQFEAHGIHAPSRVGDQPMTDGETRQGAFNRAAHARDHFPEADYWIGIEGGIDTVGETLQAFAWVVVLSRHNAGQSRTGTFFLPDEIARLVRAGHELGEADDIVFGRSNSKQQNGAVGILTGDAVDRVAFYEQAVILALIPFKNPGLSFTFG